MVPSVSTGAQMTQNKSQTKDRKQNNSKQDLTTKRSKTIQIQCSPVLAEGPPQIL